MNIKLQIPRFTFDDFCVLIKDHQNADLIDGVIYMASPDNLEANNLYVWLSRLLCDYLDEREIGGQVNGSRVAFRLDENNSPEPDIAYVLPERISIFQKGFVDGPPDLAMEIVSPESVERDYKKKRHQYEKAGVAEYWIIDPLRQKVTLLHLATRGKYRAVKPTKGAFSSLIVEGFWLRPEWLWRNPLPKKSQILTEILARA